MLCVNLYLQKLNLSNTKIDDKTTKILIKGISQTRSLHSLVLSKNEITCGGAILLCQILATPEQNIKSLHLDQNLIKEPGAKAIAKLLEINNYLEILYLNLNQIPNKGRL